jgi:hypothetical protein
VALAGLVLGACSIHVTKNGLSGNVLGHKFSAAAHQLPAGFPSDIPTPTGATVIGGAGTSNGNSNDTGWDAAFAVTGTVAAGAASYQQQFTNAGYTISNVQSPTSTTPTSGASSSGGSTSTTVTLTGAGFTATNATWTVNVLLGSSSSAVGSELKPGQYGINIVAVPTSSTTTTTG